MAYTEKDFNLSWGDITIGQANTLVVTRPSALYSFSFRYDFQGVSAAVSSEELTVVSQNDTRVVYSWTPEESLSLAIPDSVSGSGTLTMTVAFNSSIPQLSNPNYCTKTYAFTAYVPDTMRPSATLTVALVNDNDLLAQWGLWVRGMSCLQYTVEASAVGGASLAECRFTFAGQTVKGFSGTTAPIGMAGTLTPTAVVTDSRGRTTTVSAPAVSVFDYQTPSMQTSVAFRCNAAGVEDSGGACLRVKATGSCWPLDGRNTVTLRARYRPVGGTYGGYTTLVSGLTTQIAETLDKDTTYEVELSAIDTVGSVRAVSYTSSNAAVAFHLRSGGVGAAFGKLADSPMLQCAWDAGFDGDVTVAGKATSQFGTYVQRLSAYLEANPEALTQYYGFCSDLAANVAAVDAAFSSYRLDTEGYIRTGIVYYDGPAPVYGVAVGQNLTTTEIDGRQVVEQNNFRAVFTAQKLSFWQDSTEIAYVSNNRLYITSITVLDSISIGSWRMESGSGLTFKWIGG